MDIKPDTDYAKIITLITSTGFEIVIILLTLCLVIFYNFSYFLYDPPTGVWLDYENEERNSAKIFSLSPESPGVKAGLQVGDRIMSINGRAITNLNVPIHQPKKAGDVEIYVIQRQEQTLTIPLEVGKFTDHLNYMLSIRFSTSRFTVSGIFLPSVFGSYNHWPLADIITSLQNATPSRPGSPQQHRRNPSQSRMLPFSEQPAVYRTAHKSARDLLS
jgi:hypothetical protein